MKALLLFAKYPEPGKVKTRLARSVGEEEAARIYGEMLKRVVLQTRPAASEYQQCLYFDPPEKEEAFSRWFGFLDELKPQKGKELGERLSNAFQEFFQKGNESVIAVGTDCPDLDHPRILEALDRLKENDLVLGPARDGGYYLIGCRRYYPALFKNISWSTDQVLKETLMRADEMKLKISLLPILSDVDE